MTKSRTLVAGCVLTTMSLAAQVAPQAADTVHVPGTACRPKKADVSKTNYNSSSIVNEASSTATVVCPVHFQDNPFDSPISLEIFAVDRNSGNINCTVTAFADLDIAPGNIWQESGSSSGSSTAVQAIQSIDGNAFDLQSVPGVMFSFSCTLPSSSSSSNRTEIVSYRLESF